MCPKLIELLSWNGPTVHVCCFMLARASTKTFVSRVQKNSKIKCSLAEKFVSRVTRQPRYHCILFRKSAAKIQFSLKSDQNNGYIVHEDTFNLYYVAHFFLERVMLQTKFAEKIKTHSLCPVFFFPPENRTVYEIFGGGWMADPVRLQMPVQYGARAQHPG